MIQKCMVTIVTTHCTLTSTRLSHGWSQPVVQLVQTGTMLSIIQLSSIETQDTQPLFI